MKVSPVSCSNAAIAMLVHVRNATLTLSGEARKQSAYLTVFIFSPFQVSTIALSSSCTTRWFFSSAVNSDRDFAASSYLPWLTNQRGL